MGTLQTKDAKLASIAKTANTMETEIAAKISALNEKLDGVDEKYATLLRDTMCQTFTIPESTENRAEIIEQLQPAIAAHIAVANAIATFTAYIAVNNVKARLSNLFPGDLPAEIEKFTKPTWCCVQGVCQLDVYPFKHHKLSITFESGNVTGFSHHP